MARKPKTWEWLTGITAAQRDLAIRRSEFLVDGIGASLSLRDLLANAYLQGLIDASEVMATRDRRAATPLPAKH
jgi:hypothetical protein